MDWESVRFLYLRRVVGSGLAILGPGRSERMGLRLARRVWGMGTRGRRRAEEGVRAALGEGALHGQVEAIVATMYEHIARFWVEAIFVQRLLRDSSWRRFVRVENEGAFGRLMGDRSKGCLLVGACLGNPAAAAVVMGAMFRPIHVVVDRAAQPVLRAWQGEACSIGNVRMVERAEAGRRLPGILEGGGAVFMLGDQMRRRGPAVEARFLGREMRCYPTAGRLARWCGARVAVVSCVREVGRRGAGAAAFGPFAIRLEDVIEPEGDEAGIVRRTMGAMERGILRSPEQYLWGVGGGNGE